MVSRIVWSGILRSAATSVGVKPHSNFPIIKPLWYGVRSFHLLSLPEIDPKGVRGGIGLMLKSMCCETRVGKACQKRKKNGLICGVTVPYRVVGGPIPLSVTHLVTASSRKMTESSFQSTSPSLFAFSILSSQVENPSLITLKGEESSSSIITWIGESA